MIEISEKTGNMTMLPMNFKELHIGELIKQRVLDCKMDSTRICAFFKCTENEMENMYNASSLEIAMVLKWSTLLKYDFFRIYSQYLILYAPPGTAATTKPKSEQSDLPQFRKNLYTKDIIDFILKVVKEKKKTTKEVVEEYNIPKTTLYKWIKKYGNK